MHSCRRHCSSLGLRTRCRCWTRTPRSSSSSGEVAAVGTQPHRSCSSSDVQGVSSAATQQRAGGGWGRARGERWGRAAHIPHPPTPPPLPPPQVTCFSYEGILAVQEALVRGS